MPKKKSSSRAWLKEHFNDPYVKQAQKLGYRSRAVFKIQELHERYKLFQPGMTVIDLGAAPGGWSQYVVKLLGRKGRLIALDILPMEALDGVEFIQGDFTQDAVLHQLEASLAEAKVDWVLSDMAPNISGIDSVDQPRSIQLGELALELAIKVQAQGFVVKVFQGEGFDPFLIAIRQAFKKVVIRKPKASRDRSREVYLVGTQR